MVGIISNSAALFAQRNLGAANSISENSIARLSSGEKIIKASDDVSGLAIGTVLKTTVSTLKTLLGSASQAQSLLQIADGGLKNIGDLLQRQKSLAVTANSGAQTAATRAYLNSEFQALVSEIDRIATSTNFNGITILDGSIADLGNTTKVIGDDETAANFYASLGTVGSYVTAGANNFTGDAGYLDMKLYGNLGDAKLDLNYISTTNIQASLTVNGSQYVGTIAANNTAAQTVTFRQVVPLEDATQGVTFDLSIDIGNAAITTQLATDTLANNVHSDLSNLNIRQAVTYDKGYAGIVTAFNVGDDVAAAEGSILEGIDLENITFNLIDAENVTIGEFESEATFAEGTGDNDNVLRVVVNGVTFESKTINSTITFGTGTNTTGDNITLTATDNSGQTININLDEITSATADFTIDGDTNEGLGILVNALNNVFRGTATDAVNFQVGVQSSDVLGLSLASAKTANIYRDATGTVQELDISTAEGASAASTVLDLAINTITGFRSTVGALQSRFNFVTDNINTSIQNTDSARSGFLDADVAEESSTFATAQVRLQASISVLAQANQLPQNLLKLIG